MKKKKTQAPLIRYNPKKEEGLSKEQVDERILAGKTNNPKIRSSHSYFSIFVKNTFTFFNMIWAIIAIALLIVESYADLMFLFVIVANTAIAIIQEIKAKITVEKLSLQTKPMVKVIRDSNQSAISSDELVLDDIIILSNGDQVPSDCIIIDGNAEVNESLLTGESVAIKKSKGSPLLAGSFLVSGHCFARVDKVGVDNYIQTIAAKAKEFKAPTSNLFKDLNNLIKCIGILLIPLGALTFLKELSIHNVPEAIQKTSGAITGMIPAGMFLLITIALSVGVIKLAKKKTLVKDMYSIEMLARTNVLCLDKTGTITDGTMNVVDVVLFEKQKLAAIEEIMANIVAAQKSSNATFRALIDKFGTKQTLIPTKILEFSSDRKFSATTFSNGKTYYLGAPSFTGVKLNENHLAVMKEKMAEGLRVIALVEASSEYDENVGAKGEKLLALLVLEDHIRTDAIETIAWFRNNDVAIKIISGDDPLTVSKIAQRVGVDKSDKYISLENVSLDEVETIADKYTVFGRVSPEQKYILVKSLKAKGNIVAMTGDGVNDTLALKEADCSIAMADGSEVARNISKLVLMDSKFSSLPSVVKEGRQVVNNVQNSSVLFLMKTLFTILLCTITLIMNDSYPFSPKQLLLVETFVIGIPSFILTFEPNKKLIQGNFIPQVLKKSLPRAFIIVLAVLAIIAIGPERFGVVNSEELGTITTLVLTTVAFGNMCWLCITPPSWLRAGIIAISTIGIAGAAALLPKLFGLTIFTDRVFIYWAIVSSCAIGLMLIVELIRYLIIRTKRQKKKPDIVEK